MLHIRAYLVLVLALLTGLSSASATEYPLTIEHKFGKSVIPQAPQRVATVDYAGTDNLLALGFQPLTALYWFGEYDDSIWPWARPLLDSAPVVLRGELDFEQIAATRPEVIFAIRSGIDQASYDQLSKIAPVIAVPEGVGDYALTWTERARLVGRVLDREAEVEDRIATINAQLAEVRAAHPDWAGHTFAMATYWNGVGVYTAEDTSVVLVNNLGLTVAPSVEELSEPGQYYVSLSEERLPMIDADVLFWYSDDDAREQIEQLALRPQMRAYREGREIFLPTNSLRNGALSYGTLLSLPEAIKQLTPLIERAIDGDPATEVLAGE